MERLLFLDACVRGPELSRTWRLCQRFLEEYTTLHPQAQVCHRDLRESLPILTGELARQRDGWIARGEDDPRLTPAREIASANLVVVGAPYWDLSFPAVLKVYVEWSSALGITFRYAEDGRQVGLSQARALVYLTSAGGPVEGQNYGFDYLKALGAMFGIPHAYCVAAEGLDIQGTDVQAVLRRAGDRAAALARQLAQEPMCLHG